MTDEDIIRDKMISCLNNKKFEQLIDYCDKMISTDKDNYRFYSGRGTAYKLLEKYEKAIQDFDNAIGLNKTHALSYYNRGLCYYSIEKEKAAISDLKKAKSMDDSLSDIDFYIGANYYYSENSDKAIEYLTYHLENNEDLMALDWRSELFFHTGQNEKALIDVQRIFKIENDNLQKYIELNKIPDPGFDLKDKVLHEFHPFKLGFSLYNEKIKSPNFGIYILKFSNNEFYIGQSKRIKSRIKEHYKKFFDISSIYFKPAEKRLLLEEESKTIAIFENNKIRIRNLKQIEFINIFNAEKQKKWISDNNFNETNGLKFDNQNIRADFHDRYIELTKKKYYNEIIDLVANYVSSTIPNFMAGEYNYWNVTCLPKYLKREKCVVRININSVPVLSIFETDNKSLSIMLFISKVPFIQEAYNENFVSMFKKFTSFNLGFREAFSDKTQNDEVTIHIDQNDFRSILKNKIILSSIRMFNLRMLNNAGKEVVFRRKARHCLDLSDSILENIQK